MFYSWLSVYLYVSLSGPVLFFCFSKLGGPRAKQRGNCQDTGTPYPRRSPVRSVLISFSLYSSLP
jgi:hypothetical protein